MSFLYKLIPILHFFSLRHKFETHCSIKRRLRAFSSADLTFYRLQAGSIYHFSCQTTTSVNWKHTTRSNNLFSRRVSLDTLQGFRNEVVRDNGTELRTQFIIHKRFAHLG